MFEKFLAENLDSFRQRYEGTYGFYCSPGVRLLVRLTEISPTRCTFVDARNVEYHVAPDHPGEVGFEFLPPKSQWYNTEDGAIFAQRIAARQFQRGVTTKTVELGALLKGDLHTVRTDFKNLTSIYENPVAPKDAFPRLSGDSPVSVAISPAFALDPYRERVYLYRAVIGSYELKGKKLTFRLDEPQLWRTEINDSVLALGCTAEIN